MDKPAKLTLTGVKAEEIGQDKQRKPVAYFQEDARGLVLNKGSYLTLTEAHGSADTDTWLGCTVELRHDPKVRFGSKVVGGIVISVVKAAKAAKPAK